MGDQDGRHSPWDQAAYEALPGQIAPAYIHPLQLELMAAEQAQREALYGTEVNPLHLSARATPARALRLRLCTDRLEGPGWLGLLCQCAWLRGGIVGAT
jgi:hypothetical protein